MIFKKIQIFSLFSLLLFSFLVSQVNAEEKISDYYIDIEIREDGSISVVERITYDFGDEERRGIIRTIPDTYRANGAAGKIMIDFVSVTDPFGEPYRFVREDSGNQAKIKIGDPDITFTGEKVYRIEYEVEHAVGFFGDFDEVYWNALGGLWNVPIEQVSVGVTLPDEGTFLRAKNFCGVSGSKNSCGEARVRDQRVTFDPPSRFQNQYQEGFTIAVQFEKGFVKEPGINQKIVAFVKRYWPGIIPFYLVFFFGRKRIEIIKRRQKFFRENPLGVEYDEGDYTVYQASYLHDYGVERSDFGAFAVWLAVHGYLTIREEDEGVYSFIPTEDKRKLNELSADDQKVIQLLHRASPIGKGSLIHDFKNAELFEENGEKITRTMKILGDRKYLEGVHSSQLTSRWVLVFLCFFASVNPGVFIWVLLGEEAGIIFSGTCILYGIFNLIVSRYPNFTEEGLRAERYIKGLERYIKKAEKDRMNTLNERARTPELYEKLLPYAMIFGLEDKWSEQFSDLINFNPDWYQGRSQGISFSPQTFASNMSSMSKQLQTATRPAGSSSSGFSGGSSGGGGGGGGGGSW